MESVDTGALVWAYDTPLNAPRRGLESPPDAQEAEARLSPAERERQILEELYADPDPASAGTISPMLHPRRDTPESTGLPGEDGWQALGVGVLLLGGVTLALSAALAFFVAILLAL